MTVIVCYICVEAWDDSKWMFHMCQGLGWWKKNVICMSRLENMASHYVQSETCIKK